ncbi:MULTISPECIES: biotin-dependent carboxyltransferase family protein [unclassified Streptosporangium]|uniref:5-oxoprolinase subunit C family protein n=1 Tax=unclassified Streptosporangium TaxID=2632669 RepID=UPI002E2B84F1|nr:MULTISPECIES: biotin-dependent carboxyltransferase family protein [unclassified Streptosporangium]
MIEVIAPGPYATVQDLGRPGYAHLGVPRSGAADEPSLRLANRLVGNPENAAGIELTFGGARLRFTAGAWVAVTGATCLLDVVRPREAAPGGTAPTAPGGASVSGMSMSGVPASTGGASTGQAPPGGASVGGAPPGAASPGGASPGGVIRRMTVSQGMCAPFWVPAGGELRLGTPGTGLRTYVAVRGGVDVPATMGSRSADSLSGLGPPPLRAGTVLPVGPTGDLPPITVDAAPPPESGAGVLRFLPGPRDDWFVPGALATLCAGPYEVSQDSNRVGVRMRGACLERARDGELPSEGMVAGAVQVPPSGQPIVFLADHPPTGGYPVIAVLTSASLAGAAQLRPGDRIRFRRD